MRTFCRMIVTYFPVFNINHFGIFDLIFFFSYLVSQLTEYFHLNSLMNYKLLDIYG